MKKSFVFLLFVSVMVGCSIQEQPTPFQIGDEIPWRAQACHGSETKVILDGTALFWNERDQLGVFAEGKQVNRRFQNTGGTSFDGSMLYTGENDNEIEYYAYYPYIYAETPSTTIKATLPMDQVAPFDGAYNYMVADVIRTGYVEEDMPALSFEFNNQLLSIVKLTVTNSDEVFAGQELLGVELYATSGETLSGSFTFDVTKPSSKPIFSTTPSQISSKVVSTYPESARPVLGKNKTHSLYLLTNPTSVSSLKVVVKTTDYVFTASSTVSTSFPQGRIISLPQIDIKGLSCQKRIRRCVLWGDSLTSNASYPENLQKLLGPDWEVISGGVGGDTVLGIGGRQGGIPLRISGAFTIPSSDTESVSIDNIYTTKNESNEDGAVQWANTRYNGHSGALINPCVIKFNDGVQDVEVEGNLTIGAGKSITFRRSVIGDTINVPDNAVFITQGAKDYKNADLIVIYMGTNGNYTSYSALAGLYQAMIDYTTNGKAIVVGFHMSEMTISGKKRVFWTEEYRNVMQASFNQRYVDLFSLGTNPANALRLLKATGKYSSLASSLNEADNEAVTSGHWPQSFASTSTYTDVHFNNFGSHAMAILVKERMEQLGYLDY